MDNELQVLLERARSQRPTQKEREEQALENAFANGAMSDPRITRETIRATATIIAQADKSQD